MYEKIYCRCQTVRQLVVLLHWAGIIFFSYPDNIKKEGGAGAAE